MVPKYLTLLGQKINATSSLQEPDADANSGGCLCSSKNEKIISSIFSNLAHAKTLNIWSQVKL